MLQGNDRDHEMHTRLQHNPPLLLTIVCRVFWYP